MTQLGTTLDASHNDKGAREYRRVVVDWLGALDAATTTGDVGAVISLFVADPWWKDLYALTWDITVMHGAEEIKSILDAETVRRFGNIRFDDGYSPVLRADTFIEALFRFTTEVGVGRGAVRLVKDTDGVWRGWTLSTSLDGLRDYPELVVTIDDAAKDEYNLPLRPGERRTWEERETERVAFRNSEPSVLILGAGHAGLFLAARLKQLGVPHLVVDTYARAGDNWRLRYSNLLLHDPKWFVEFPYMPFPETWPLFAPKEWLADWIEAYVKFLQLNLWTSAQVSEATYDDKAKRWTVVINHDGEQRTLHPNHLVFATGLHGIPTMPNVRGSENFKGMIVHSSQHKGGASTIGKKVIVVGTGSSGCDVVQDAYENGASVTLVQRGETYIFSQRNGVPLTHRTYYSETGPPIDVADVLAASMPLALSTERRPTMTRLLADLDKELLEGLERAGFKTTLGPGDTGVMWLSFVKGGGYYIDKGAAQLIIEGSVRVQRGEIDHFYETGVVYTDGTAEDADLVVFCTGYANMREATRPIVGNAVADQLGLVWGLDDHGELRTVFRHSGHEKLWFVAGGFQNCRFGSKHLAMVIKAIDVGILDPHISVEKRTAIS